jgi:hypothetical protein
LSEGAVQSISTLVPLTVVVTVAGCSGAAEATTVRMLDQGPKPYRLTARTSNLYEEPGVMDDETVKEVPR